MSIAIDVTAWAADRATGIATLAALGIAEADENGDIVPMAGISAHIHPARAAEDIAIPGAPGWHVNIRYYGATALNLLAEVPEGGWTLADGLFERTLILDLIDARTGQAPQWYALEEIPQPPGYQMAGGAVRLYDPALISSQSCVWG
jgi:hypothetical protein